jgi:hypothetical protein
MLTCTSQLKFVKFAKDFYEGVVIELYDIVLE